jgi:hypothetical protein
MQSLWAEPDRVFGTAIGSMYDGAILHTNHAIFFIYLGSLSFVINMRRLWTRPIVFFEHILT